MNGTTPEIIKQWHEVFNSSPGLIAIIFLTIGLFIRELIEITDILVLWFRKLLIGERREKCNKKD